MNDLPVVDGMVQLSSATWAALGRRLRDMGFVREHASSLRRAAVGAQADALQRPIVLWHLRRRDDPVALALRMFVLADPVPVGDARRLLTPSLLDALADAAMLYEPSPGTMASRFDLRVFSDMLILCDDLLQGGDAVYGAGYGTAAFANLTQRRPPRRALDVGCGAGAVALSQARRAEHVVATDVNKRALTFVRINAAMNGVANVEVREGYLFRTVGDERFDLITSQPPYVPRPPEAGEAAYLYGGRRGDELVRELLAELPSHLTVGGRAMVVFEHLIIPSSGHVSPTLPPDCRALLILGDEVGADAYSLRYAAPELRRGISAFDTAATSMRAHLHEMGIAGLCPSVAVVERVQQAGGWTAVVPGGDNLWNELTVEAIDRLIAAQVVTRYGPGAARQARINLPDESLVIRGGVGSQSAGARVHLGLPPGYLVRSIALSAGEWDALAGGGALEPALLERAAQAGLVEPDGAPP